MSQPVLISRHDRLDSLTGARFVAAFLVFAFHAASLNIFASEAKIGVPLSFMTRVAGTVGVSFFFLLSGFVLTWSARPGDTLGSFLLRRVVKIYPNHVVTFCLAMLLFAASATPLARALPNLLLVHAWIPDPQTFLGVNGPSWSLSCELLFYLLFPVLLWLARRIDDARLWRWAGGVAGLIVVMPSMTVLLPATPRFGDGFTGTILLGQSTYSVWFLYIFPPIRALDFLLGILVARIVLSGRWINLNVLGAGVLTAVAYVVGLFLPLVYSVNAVTVVPLALLIAALATTDVRGATSALRAPVMRRLGEVSFAFYLVHEIVLLFLRGLVGYDRRFSLAGGFGLIVLGLAISLGLAFLLHTWVETPAMLRWGGLRRPASVGRQREADTDRGEQASAISTDRD